MTVEELLHLIENDIDTCYLFNDVYLVKEVDIYTDKKELKEYFDCKVKSFKVELIKDDYLGEVYDLYITFEEETK
jgi:hypothetical protein